MGPIGAMNHPPDLHAFSCAHFLEGERQIGKIKNETGITSTKEGGKISIQSYQKIVREKCPANYAETGVVGNREGASVQQSC
jgi:hypothetical protein